MATWTDVRPEPAKAPEGLIARWYAALGLFRDTEWNPERGTYEPEAGS